MNSNDDNNDNVSIGLSISSIVLRNEQQHQQQSVPTNNKSNEIVDSKLKSFTSREIENFGFAECDAYIGDISKLMQVYVRLIVWILLKGRQKIRFKGGMILTEILLYQMLRIRQYYISIQPVA